MEAIFRLMHRTPRNLLLLAVSVMLSVSALGRQAENREVERLLFNGKVFTAEPDRPYAEAVGIRGTRIVAVGRRDEVAAALGPEAEPLDLQGRMLLPGFIDVHNHAVEGGRTLNAADVSEAAGSVPDLAAFVAEARKSKRGMIGGVLKITGVPLDIWTRFDELEATFSSGDYETLPVYLYGMDYHTAWANRALRQRAGVTREWLSGLSEGDLKYYGVRPDGEPNGFFLDVGLTKIKAVIPKPSDEDLVKAGRLAVAHLNQLGITAWMDPYAEAPVFRAYRELARRGELSARVAVLPVVRFPPLEVKTEFDPFIGLEEFRKELGDVANLTVPGVKVFADGVAEFPSQTAAMSLPYRNSGKRGDLLFEPGRFSKLCLEADQRGLIVHVHAIGDRGVTEALNGFATARQANGPSGPQHIITHLQFVQPTDFLRFQQLGIVAAVQLYWASANRDAIDNVKPYLDPGIYAWLYPVRSLLHAGVTIAGASDWPVSTANVFHAIYHAETRKGPLGVLDVSQCMPREAMLYAYTRNAALAMGQLDQIGSIAPGKAADLVLLDRDILIGPAEEMRETQVVWTMVGGKKVYERR